MKVVIIAEAGVNHNGSVELAKNLIDVAADAGVDFVKFQTFKTNNLVTKTAQKADYQKDKSHPSFETQYEMLKKLELSNEDHILLSNHAIMKGIGFLSTAFDLESIDYLEKLGIDIFKIPSGEITNLKYLERIAKTKKPVIMSTGMATLSEIKEAVDLLISNGLDKDNLTILHCTTEYPAPMDEVNLRAMVKMAKDLEVKIGYSDHTKGIEISLAAVALGACVIEKHFTLDRNMTGPDHQSSIEPNELNELVKSIRNIQKAMGSEEKKPTASEMKNKIATRKSIVASKVINIGDRFSDENLTVKRPGNGISPMLWNTIIGKHSNRIYQPDDKIEL